MGGIPSKDYPINALDPSGSFLLSGKRCCVIVFKHKPAEGQLFPVHEAVFPRDELRTFIDRPGGRKAMVEKAKSVFMDYASRYDMSNIMVSHKVSHTMRVAELSARIAKSHGLCESDVSLAWMLGLLHDFGRFEQFRQYGTFWDSESADHAELGADLLFCGGFAEAFVQAGLPAEELSLAETAIRLHNKLALPDSMPDRTRTFSQILRDADKIDIFRVVDELPFEQRAGKSIYSFHENGEASPECMEYVFRHRCIPRSLIRSRFEVSLSLVCFAFELCYEESRHIAAEQGYLRRLLAPMDENGAPVWNEKAERQLEQCRIEIEKHWKEVGFHKAANFCLSV